MYGYSLDGSDFPCYLVWPWRTDSNSFFLLESQSRRYVALDQAGFLHPLGLRHFYDGFSLRAGISIRSAALAAFDLHEDELSNDLIVSQAAVVDRGWIDHQEQPVDQNAPEADRRNVPEEVISVSDGEVDRVSTIGGCSSQASCSTTSSDEDSDTSEPARSEVSVQDSMMEHAYQSLQDAFLVKNGQLVGGDGTLNQLEFLPFHWPLAKLTLPLKFGVNRLRTGGRLLNGANGHEVATLAMQTTNQFLRQNSHCSSCNISCQRNRIVVSTCAAASGYGSCR